MLQTSQTGSMCDLAHLRKNITKHVIHFTVNKA